ncbi:patatin-like phospholipase family protein [Micromonospora endophytica]|nr:patatin-like phospholipase family protein [Micromonospora endophytica]BCJ61307.1 hypothetical protein Jiend_47290 [Micromonospora endophytica]
MTDDRLRRIAERAQEIEKQAVAPGTTGPPQVPPPIDVTPPGLPRIGLLLGGGAAKGAYELGAIEALAAQGLSIEAIAGSSIGALNGVVLACAPDLPTGAQRLGDLWTKVSSRLSAAVVGQPGRPDDSGEVDEAFAVGVANLPVRAVRLLLDNGYLEQLVEQVVDVDTLRVGPPMWVTGLPVGPPPWFPLERAVQHAVNWLAARLGKAELLHLNHLPRAEVCAAVLASAALPFLFSSRRVGERYYADGGLGQDKVPVRAFAAQGCELVIAVHLDALDVLRERDRAGIKLLEVRPSRPLSPKGLVGAANGLLDFSPQRMAQLRALGHADMTTALTSYAQQAGLVWLRRESQRAALEAVSELREPPTPPR